MRKVENIIDILVIGAGASGLAAARELSRKGKKVTILEARNRIGGRIWSFAKEEFGYPAQGGGEFVHGKAPVTMKLAKECGMTLIPMQGEMWNSDANHIGVDHGSIPNWNLLSRRLKELKKDMPVMEFLNSRFPGKKYVDIRSYIIGMTQGYDAADPKRASTFSLRDEWLGDGGWLQYRIKEGYGKMLLFLESKCAKQGVEIKLDTTVKEIHVGKDSVTVNCIGNKMYAAKKVLVTVPLPIIKKIKFRPAIPKKLEAASEMGFGGAIKILLKFKERWWINTAGKDLRKMDFIFSNEEVGSWWTQYPDSTPVLTGWIAGPKATKLSKNSTKDILDMSLDALSRIFKIEKGRLKKQLVSSRVINWVCDPFAHGAYSYPTVEARKAQAEITKPVKGRVFFAGEALYSGEDTATVEGALGSGMEMARKMLATK